MESAVSGRRVAARFEVIGVQAGQYLLHGRGETAVGRAALSLAGRGGDRDRLEHPSLRRFESEQPGWTRFTGQSFDRLRGWGWLNAIHPDDRSPAPPAGRGRWPIARFTRSNIDCGGTKDPVVFNLEGSNQLQLYLREDEKKGLQGFRTINVTESNHPYVGNYWPSGHIIGYEHSFINTVYDLINGINDGKNPKPDFTDGLECQKVMESVENSIEQGKWVSV